jgi:hypothetical protein
MSQKRASTLPHKIAFYPCCGRDFDEPTVLLAGIVDEIIFCDIDRRVRRVWNDRKQVDDASLPRTTLRINDLRDEIKIIPVIDILFYRRDSAGGEGGSGVFVLGDSVLPFILEKFNPAGGWIITDGSNSRGSNFKRMKRKSGLIKHGCRFSAPDDQPFLDEYGLRMISVTRAEPSIDFGDRV